MQKLNVSLIVLTILIATAVSMGGTVYISDGLSHIFNDTTYQNDDVRLDNYGDNNPGTHVDLVDGGVVGFGLTAFRNASVTMSGGSTGGLTGHHDSSITMTDGSVGNNLFVYHNASITMSGGSVGNDIWATGNGTITLSGGSFAGLFSPLANGTIYLDGTGFEITDLNNVTTSLSNGDKLSDFGTFVDSIFDFYTGTITGTLADNSALNNNVFKIYNTGQRAGIADIIIIPEPATICLLGLGLGCLRLRKRVTR